MSKLIFGNTTVLFFLMIALFSCGSAKTPNEQIIGTWQQHKIIRYYTDIRVYNDSSWMLKFDTNGWVYDIWSEVNSTFSLKDDTLLINETYHTIVELNEDRLVFKEILDSSNRHFTGVLHEHHFHRLKE